MGRPALFIRLSRCIPPFCPWCDTAYARESGKMVGISEILEAAGAFQNDLVIVTGGEPFLQWKTALQTLERCLIDKGYSIQYETSGKTEIPENSCGFKVCSPKFLEGKWWFITENATRADAFKFVVRDDFENVREFSGKYGIPNEKIWIMPFGASRNEQLERIREVWEFCVENNFNFAPRLHILAFDQQKGI